MVAQKEVFFRFKKDMRFVDPTADGGNRSYSMEISLDFPKRGYNESRNASAKMVDKEHYRLRRTKGRITNVEILIIFFGIHTANAEWLAMWITEDELT